MGWGVLQKEGEDPNYSETLLTQGNGIGVIVVGNDETHDYGTEAKMVSSVFTLYMKTYITV